MNEFTHLSDENLIDIYLVYQYRHSEEYNQQLFEELQNRNINIKDFDDDIGYINSFIRSFPDGWSLEIKNMFDELVSLRWNKSMHIEAKEKWGHFTFSGGNLSEEFYELIEQHATLINESCSRCGSKDYVQENGAGWIEILCRKCQQDDLMKLAILDISEKGFTYCNVRSSNTEFLWKDIASIELDFSEDEQSINIEMNRTVEIFCDVEFKDLHFHLFHNLNFFKLLKNIPEDLLSSSNLEKRNTFFNDLKKCHFCDKKTLYLGTCLLCRESLDRILASRYGRYMQYYNNIPQLIENERKDVLYLLERINEKHFFFHHDYFL